MTDEDGFLRRWSRRKTAEKNHEPAVADPPRDAAAVPATGAAIPEPETGTVAPEDLPDIDGLDESSDFSVFMRDGVPEQLKTLALRRLWRLDPMFNEVDGLLEYGEDFTKISLAAVKSVYQVGKGMVAENEEEEEGKGEELDDAEGEGGADDEAEKTVALEEIPDPARSDTDGPQEPEKT